MLGKILITMVFVVGISTTVYGRLKHNNEVFLIGMVFIIVGYACVRTKLRRYFGAKSR
jgi:hypothetical protein